MRLEPGAAMPSKPCSPSGLVSWTRSGTSLWYAMTHTNEHFRFIGLIWFHTYTHANTTTSCVIFHLPNAPTIHYFQKDFRVQELPLARIKKIMKLDEDVKVRGQATITVLIIGRGENVKGTPQHSSRKTEKLSDQNLNS